MPRTQWLEEPAEKDYAAAASYLSLLLDADGVERAVASLRASREGHWRAKDILRAADLPLLTAKSSAEVADKLAAIRAKKALSPILLIHDGRRRLVIADGYHRACAAHLVDEDTLVPGRLALFPGLLAGSQ